MLGDQALRREQAGEALAPLVTRQVLEGAAALVPDEWLVDEGGFDSPGAVRAAYVEHLLRRVEVRRRWQP